MATILNNSEVELSSKNSAYSMLTMTLFCLPHVYKQLKGPNPSTTILTDLA